MYLSCHLTLQDHVIKGFCDFIEGSPSLYRTNMPSLVAVVTVIVKITYLICQVNLQDGGHRHCGNGDVLIYHVASHHNMFKGLSNFVGGSFL